MSTLPKRRWLSRFSPFRWVEAWLDRIELRQKAMLAEAEIVGRQIAASRAQVTELRAEIERLQAEAAELWSGRDLPLPAITSSPPTNGRRCPRGHTAPAAARFCPECGHVFPTRSSGGSAL